MLYVESVTYSLLINGEKVGCLCQRGINGLTMENGLEPLSHLMFADDTFCSLWSGQSVNVQKSTIVFSPSVDAQTRGMVIEILGIPKVPTHGKYLGLPTSIGASKKEVFKSVLDRIRTKVDNWKSRLLLKADTKNKKIYWVSWTTLCKSKEEGGLGFRKAQDFNNALLYKQAWRFLTDPNSILALTYKARADIPYWSSSPRGVFTVKGTYHIQRHLNNARSLDASNSSSDSTTFKNM
ncbi:hypothetical protein LIER_11678 [Lithospermum erythrorhizon]|uniref:Uncharacterized protein n=1 Tax=Lithospermum erythrorhizon TaxID=34254 RepID=A0AAV3PT89_LITER